MKRFLPWTLVLALLAVSGCVIESTLEPAGSAVVKISYRTVGGKGKLETERKKMEGPNVTVTSGTIDDYGKVTFELKVKDVTKLSTSKFFQHVTVTLTDGSEGTKVLSAKLVNTKPLKLDEKMLEYFGHGATISVTTPGDITASNATTTSGKTATWTKPLTDVMGAPEMTFTVTFKA